MSVGFIEVVLRVLGGLMLIAGIALTVSGAVTRKRGMWIPGVILIAAGVLILAAPFVLWIFSSLLFKESRPI